MSESNNESSDIEEGTSIIEAMENIEECTLIEAFEKETNTPAKYTRGGKEYDTKAFREWKKPKKKESNYLNQYHEIEAELKDKIDIVSFKKNILIKIDNAYTDDLDVLLQYLNILAKKHKVGYKTIKSDIIESLTDSSIVNSDFFCYDAWLLNFPNGYYDFKENKFISAQDCTKEFIFAIKRKYNEKESDCPLFKEALGVWLKGNNIITKDDIFEFMVYSLMLGNFLKAFFLNVGETNTGKTQIMEILKAFVPSFNRIQISLQRLSSDQFGSWGLNNIILCYYDDMSDKTIWNTDMIKSITGGASEISMEAKHGRKRDIMNTSKIWHNGNYIPMINNSNDLAYLDRAMIIEFLNVIDRFSKKHMEQFHLLITESDIEMDGIIIEMIKAGKRLYERGNFRKEIKDYSKNYYVYKSNEAYAFIQDHCIIDSKGRIEFDKAKELINDYRIKRKKSIFSSQAIKKVMESEGFFKGDIKVDGKKTYIIRGLTWKVVSFDDSSVNYPPEEVLKKQREERQKEKGIVRFIDHIQDKVDLSDEERYL